MMGRRNRFVGLGVAVSALLVLVACTSTPELPDPVPWQVDTSGWWLPADGQACLEETTQCRLAGYPTRSFIRGASLFNAVGHGEQVDLFCSAPAPTRIGNSVGTVSSFWFYADVAGRRMWIPDIVLTPTDTGAVAEAVPECPSNTAGIGG